LELLTNIAQKDLAVGAAHTNARLGLTKLAQLEDRIIAVAATKGRVLETFAATTNLYRKGVVTAVA